MSKGKIAEKIDHILHPSRDAGVDGEDAGKAAAPQPKENLPKESEAPRARKAGKKADPAKDYSQHPKFAKFNRGDR